jgi:uncharacterized phiE125 gp8 family phage protein
MFAIRNSGDSYNCSVMSLPKTLLTSILSLDTVKHYLRVENSDDDAIIEKCINATESYLEKNIGLIISPRDYLFEYLKPVFSVQLHFKPLLKINNVTADGKELSTEDDDYKLTDDKIIFAKKQSNLTLEAQFGYSQSADLPSDIEMALLMHIAHLYDHRDGNDNIIPLMVSEIYSQYKFLRI